MDQPVEKTAGMLTGIFIPGIGKFLATHLGQVLNPFAKLIEITTHPLAEFIEVAFTESTGCLESEKVGLKLNIQKTKIMASGPITSLGIGLQNHCKW